MLSSLLPSSRRLYSVLMLAAVSVPLAAQVSLTTLGIPDTQDFNALPASGSATWTNNSTIPGWYHARTGTGTTIVANNGGSNSGNLYSYGTGTDADRALGSVGSGNTAAGDFYWGVRLLNNTGSTITSLDVSYTGEQWRNSAAAAQTAAFSYLVGSPTVTGSLAEFQSAGTAVAALDFTSPVTGGTSGALDGNLAANRTAITFTIAGLSIPNGSEIMLRWADPDHSGSDHGLSIDDFSVTPNGNGGGSPTLIISDVSLPEGNSGTTGFVFTVSLNQPAPAGGVSFNFATADGTATTADNDYVAIPLTPGSIPEGEQTFQITVTVNGDLVFEPDQTFTVNITDVTGATLGDGTGLGTITNDDCDPNATFTLIHDIQGNGLSSPLAGQVVSVEGIVSADFQGSSNLGGFFIQEETGDYDADLATSEGIFVFSNAPVSVGDKARVTGSVTEFFEKTEINNVTNIVVCGTGSVIPTLLTYPVPSVDFQERYEGMLVQIDQPMFVTDNFDHGQFGEIEISLAFPLYQPTQVTTPGANAQAFQDFNNRRRLILDDGSSLSRQNIVTWLFPEGGGLSANNTARVGDRINFTGESQLPLVGAFDFAFEAYRLVPTQPVTFAPNENPRTPAPANVGGTVRIASFNLLNYFTTLDTGAPICGPSANQDCRGANDANEFTRQRDKLINAIVAMNPLVLGVTELENNNTTSIDDLVAGLNDATFPGKFAYINTATIGTDAIRVALVYQPAVVAPVGTFAILNSADAVPSKNRPPLAQTFERIGVKSTLQRFTVVMNHFKSKGSTCLDTNDPGEISDPDTGDGQGNCNLTRTKIAQALVNWLAGNPTLDPTPAPQRKIFVVGDLNAYALEDPISAMTSTAFTNPVVPVPNPNATYVNLVKAFGGVAAHSYVFFGQRGYLDHALANPWGDRLMRGLTEWHINADEPVATDYNIEWTSSIDKTPAQQASLYDSGPYRSSDHDPLLIGFNPLCGDFDDDGDVDITDRNILIVNLGQPVVPARRLLDLNGDGALNATDANIFVGCYIQYQQ